MSTTKGKKGKAATAQKAPYASLRPHTARIIKLGQYPLHVNGGYLDDPERIPHIEGRPAPALDK